MGGTDVEKMDASLDILRRIVSDQTRLLDEMIHLLVLGREGKSNAPPATLTLPATCRVIPLLLQAAGASCHSILKLSAPVGLPIRDCFAISRAIFEALLNNAFILAGGEQLAERAERHALQKSFRDLNRSVRLGEEEVRVFHNIDLQQGTSEEVRRALDEFTGRRGQEVRDWVDASVDDKLEKIRAVLGDRVELGLQTANFSLYRHSSEILHGTYFGCLYFLGATRPATRPDVKEWELMNHAFSILQAMVFAISSVATAYSKIFDTPHIEVKSEAVFSDMHTLPIFSLIHDVAPRSRAE